MYINLIPSSRAGCGISSDKIKWNLFKALPGLNTSVWMHHKDNETHGKKLDGNYTRLLSAVFNKSWKQSPLHKTIDLIPFTSYMSNISS